MNELARRRRALMGEMAGGGILPAAYQQVEWIKSDGNQYIQTPYYPNTATVLSMDFVYLGGTQGNYYAIFGEMNGSNPYNRFSLTVGGNEHRTYLARGSAESQYLNLLTDNIRYELTVTPPSNWDFNGTIKTGGDNDFSSVATLPIGIFGRNRSGAGDRLSKVQLYSIAVEENGEKKLNLVPCYRKADLVIGLYDTVSGTFYTNSGTGSFAKGADV